MKNLLAVLVSAMAVWALSGSAVAADADVAKATEATVRQAAESFLAGRGKVESIRKAGVAGMYEVQVGGGGGSEIFYVDEKGQHAFIGDLVDIKKGTNLTEERRNKLSQIKFSDLPLSMAIKIVRGNGKRVLVSFEDPNCGYCRRFAKTTQGMTDVTLYVFPYPILSADSVDKSRNILCAADPAKAWSDWMANDVVPPTAKCDTSTDKYLAVGQRLNVRATPTFFVADGSRIPGAVPQAQIEARMNALLK